MPENFRKTRYNARVYTSRRPAELKSEMELIGSELPGIVRMSRKAFHYVVKVEGIRTPAVLILKEEMLAKGGDCAIHKDAIVGRLERSRCLLMGTEKVFNQMLADLRSQPFGLKYLAMEIKTAIDNYKKSYPVTPSFDQLSEPLKQMYTSMNKRTLVMGILNVTPDSFSDGGLHLDIGKAVEHALQMAEEGADIIDIGGESTRPGAQPMTADEELSRILPVIRALKERIDLPVSIDTYKPQVAREALDAGAHIINDITGLSSEEMCSLAAEKKCPAIIMHMKGEPLTMQQNTEYVDLVSEVMDFLRDQVESAVEAGLPEEYLIIDPGIGFAKTADQNMEIIRKLGDFKSIGRPILMGTSRKAFIGKATGGLPADERVEGTAATVALSINNGANIVRVHDVKAMVRAARMTDAIVREKSPS
ncbi:MAG: dihydropteroate synthase [Armatimonadota bacterium]